MTIETTALLGFVLAVTTLAAAAYERRMDVLYGPYVEGRAGGLAGVSTDQFWKQVYLAVDRFRWKARNIVHLASLIAC